MLNGRTGSNNIPCGLFQVLAAFRKRADIVWYHSDITHPSCTA